MNAQQTTDLIVTISKKIQIDSNLCVAISGHETNCDSSKTRFEPRWSYYYLPSYFSSKLEITMDTEKILQAISWGPMQVMGSVCRELGYTDQLPLLVQPELGILFGCKKLKQLSATYSDEKDVISAYNAGKPKKDSSGIYMNGKYVLDVLGRLNELRK